MLKSQTLNINFEIMLVIHNIILANLFYDLFYWNILSYNSLMSVLNIIIFKKNSIN